jgi:hypothetical protein
MNEAVQAHPGFAEGLRRDIVPVVFAAAGLGLLYRML